MSRTDRDVYRGTHKEDWSEKYHDKKYFHGGIPSYPKKMIRKAERSAYRRAMQRGDYEAAEMQSDRNTMRIKNVYIINYF